jgi:hypothetical protein
MNEGREFDKTTGLKTNGEMQVHWSRVLSTPSGYFPPDTNRRERTEAEEHDLKVCVCVWWINSTAVDVVISIVCF